MGMLWLPIQHATACRVAQRTTCTPFPDDGRVFVCGADAILNVRSLSVSLVPWSRQPIPVRIFTQRYLEKTDPRRP